MCYPLDLEPEEETKRLETIDCDSGPLPARVKISRFTGASGVEEYHIHISPNNEDCFEAQLDHLTFLYQNTLHSLGIGFSTTVFRRFYVSDLEMQADILNTSLISKKSETGAISWVCQPPVPPAKLSLWAYHIHDPADNIHKSKEGDTLVLKRDELSHFWTTGVSCTQTDSTYEQSNAIFNSYIRFLESKRLQLDKHLIRTWFYVTDIDNEYQGLVTARNEHFTKHGLTKDTHFVASTGIEGSYLSNSNRVFLDAYAIAGVKPEQIQFLKAPSHLSPTSDYGVAFERGTTVSYRDRKHLMISGTASIDHHGKILHEGNIQKQLDRTIENIEALLREGGASLSDLAVATVFLRNPEDHTLVKPIIEERFGSIPFDLVTAPVCRPGWLVEIEGLAITATNEPHLPSF